MSRRDCCGDQAVLLRICRQRPDIVYPRDGTQLADLPQSNLDIATGDCFTDQLLSFAEDGFATYPIRNAELLKQ
ncbi:hypothetical protein PQR10_03715 [Paraburkholderia phytofirmans]|uniref:Uncharacterized protein n=1 Tax=Paraburkholderia phytofirmans TaxID=261302 RepID=A0ABW9BDZ0_9BURK|nr:hypothetical protein [Paraburkholderia phytofirmans]